MNTEEDRPIKVGDVVKRIDETLGSGWGTVVGEVNGSGDQAQVPVRWDDTGKVTYPGVDNLQLRPVEVGDEVRFNHTDRSWPEGNHTGEVVEVRGTTLVKVKRLTNPRKGQIWEAPIKNVTVTKRAEPKPDVNLQLRGAAERLCDEVDRWVEAMQAAQPNEDTNEPASAAAIAYLHECEWALWSAVNDPVFGVRAALAADPEPKS